MKVFEVAQKYLSDYSSIIDLFTTILFLIISLRLYAKSGDVKYIKECLDMVKFNTKQFSQPEDYSGGQEFDKLIPVWRKNKITGEVEQVKGEFIDIDELVNSSKATCLQAVLERFLPDVAEVSDEVQEALTYEDELEKMQSAFDYAEELRAKYHFAEELSPQDIFAEVERKRLSLTEQIAKKKAELAKGVIENETVQNVEKGE